MTKRIVLLIASAGLFVAGCRHYSNPGGNAPPPGPAYPSASPVPFPGSGPAVPGGAPVMPPPGSYGQSPGPGQPYPPGPPQQSNLGPNPPGAWQSPQEQINLSPPEPIKPAPPVKEEFKKLPELPDVPDEDPLLKSAPPKKPVPVKESILPSGIAQFSVALPESVTSGLRPSLDGGLDWLKSKGYKTVLHIKKPGEEDAADKKQVENRGMNYVSLDVSPAGLSGKITEEFARIVSDKNNYPLFVYDKDGSLAGGLWYLYFKGIGDEEEVARVRAEALGLRLKSTDGPHYEMWLGIQKLVSDKGP